MSRYALVMVLVTAIAGTSASAADKPARVTITQKHLIATCLDQKPVAAATRQWTLEPVEHALVFTMRNAPRSGIADEAPGLAAITFTPERGHRYEVEVRAAATTFSARVWPRGAWSPVVRDRTADRVVSSEPVWIERGCPP